MITKVNGRDWKPRPPKNEKRETTLRVPDDTAEQDALEKGDLEQDAPKHDVPKYDALKQENERAGIAEEERRRQQTLQPAKGSVPVSER